MAIHTPQKVIVFGATGGTGQELTRLALKQGLHVTAFARTPSKVTQKHPRLDVFEGNVLNPEEVAEAITGKSAVFCCLGAPPKEKRQVRAEGTQNIIAGMERTGVDRLVCQTTMGIGDSRESLPFFMKHIVVPLFLKKAFADHEAQEEAIERSNLDWTIVRPAGLTNDIKTGKYKVGFPPEDRSKKMRISRADVAHFMLKQLKTDEYLRQKVAQSY